MEYLMAGVLLFVAAMGVGVPVLYGAYRVLLARR